MLPDEDLDSEELLSGEAEPWDSWETWLVSWCVAVGIVALFILGWLVDLFILS